MVMARPLVLASNNRGKLAEFDRLLAPLGFAVQTQSSLNIGEAEEIADLQRYEDKSAYYYCVLVYLRHADDPQPIIADARWHGEIIDQPRGQGGFGYDPHFWLPSLNKTAAELTPEEKNQCSHRAQALRILISQLA